MPADEKPQKTVISQTRFLVVDSEATVGDALRRFLLSEGSPAVHFAPSAVLALRVLQDRRTPVDCVICAQRPPALSGVEFLTNLRAGRWGGLALQQMKFILLMPTPDRQVVAIADSMKVTGYISGSLGRENVRQSILMALDPSGAAQTPPNFKIAHVRASETDLVIAPFPPSFGRLSAEKQRLAIQAVGAGAQKQQLNGTVVAIYTADNGEAAFVAPTAYERFLSRLTVPSVEKMLNRSIYVEWTDGDPTVDPDAAVSDEPLPLFDEEEERELERIIVRAAEPEAESVAEQSSDRRRGSPDEQRRARGLTDEDIRSVVQAFKNIGPEEFVERFVRHQTILWQGDSQAMTPMMREFYVSIDLLRTAFFPGVEMRGSQRAFQSLTHMLDQLMLRSLPVLPLNGMPCSLNINVHSILTQTFQSAMKNVSPELLTFEIPQPMIASHFGEFEKARELIYARGARIAVDQIFPDSMGALDLLQVKPNIAKIHWKGDLKSFSSTHRDFVKSTLDRGIAMVMSRVDDPAAFEIAQEFGIRNFQGFLIDEMPEAKSGGENQ
jgi:EAL domain-containing protein (putative c-di-GMP-specific phosphodiesterase class I)/DNA-binding NarL/FixJ family response regulator